MPELPDARGFNQVAETDGHPSFVQSDESSCLQNSHRDPFHGLEFPQDISLDSAANDLIDGILGPGDLCIVYGASGVGKTFLVLFMAFRLALGLPIAGRDSRSAAVLYIGYEGERGIKKRILAARAAYGEPEKMFARFTLDASLDSSDSGKQGCAAIIDAIRKLKKVSGCENVVVIVDTLSRAIAGDDENAAQSMSAFVERRAGHVSRQAGAAVICVHHAGKDEARGMRGSSALFAACDTVIAVTDGKVAVEKAKDAETGPWFGFVLEQTALGENDRGKPITTCVVIERDVPQGSLRRKKRPRGATAEACQILQRIYDQCRYVDVRGEAIGIPDADPKERWRVVKLDEWKTACREACLTVAPDNDTSTTKSKREWAAFDRAVKSLAGSYNLIGRYGNHVWLTNINRIRTGRLSSTVRQGSTSIDRVEPDDATGASIASTPPYRGVEAVEPDVVEPLSSVRTVPGRTNSVEHASLETVRDTAAQRFSPPRESKPSNNGASDNANPLPTTDASTSSNSTGFPDSTAGGTA